jgi:hypothetical protein
MSVRDAVSALLFCGKWILPEINTAGVVAVVAAI